MLLYTYQGVTEIIRQQQQLVQKLTQVQQELEITKTDLTTNRIEVGKLKRLLDDQEEAFTAKVKELSAIISIELCELYIKMCHFTHTILTHKCVMFYALLRYIPVSSGGNANLSTHEYSSIRNRNQLKRRTKWKCGRVN